MKRNVTPAAFSLVDVIEELPDLARLEPRRRLVEDDEAAALAQRPRDLEKLPLADRQVARTLVDVDVEPPHVEFLRVPAAGAQRQLIEPKREPGWSLRKRFSPTVSSGMIVDFW